MSGSPSYAEVEEVVGNRVGCGSAAEAHGLLAGLLCMDAGADFDAWLEVLEGPATSTPDARDRELLQDLFAATAQQLHDFDFSFDLLLPDDDTALDQRAAALGEWCQGYLAGLGYGSDGAGWPGHCTELLRDFGEISRLDPAGSDEADEAAYTELSEYVRVGVQVIRRELQAAAQSRQPH